MQAPRGRHCGVLRSAARAPLLEASRACGLCGFCSYKLTFDLFGIHHGRGERSRFGGPSGGAESDERKPPGLS